MANFVTPDKTASQQFQPGGLYVGDVTRVDSSTNMVWVKIPRFVLNFEFGPLTVVGPELPQVNDKVACLFFENRSDEIYVIGVLKDMYTLPTAFIVTVTGGARPTNEPIGTILFESDTGNCYIWNGSSWAPFGGGAGSQIVAATKEPIGHEDITKSSISFNEGTRTFSISPISGSHYVWCVGTRYQKSTTESVTIPNTSGLYYIYYSSTGVLSYSTTYFVWDEQTPTAYIYWNATDQKAYFFADERHGVALDWATHEYLHRTRGASIASGFTASAYTTTGDGSLPADAQIDIADGTFFDEDLQVDISHAVSPAANSWQQVLQGGAEIPVFYRSASVWKKDDATKYPFKQGTVRSQYNLNTAGSWSTVDLDQADYGISWIVATNNLNSPILAIMGQARYGNLGNAESAVWADLDLAGFPIFEMRPLYKIIFQTSSSYSNAPRTRFRGVYDMRRSDASSVGVSSAPVSALTRSIITLTSSATAESTLYRDYVYLLNGAITLTMPTAISNSNRYTVKNIHSANVTVATTSSQTIDGTATISLAPEEAVDLISDSANWRIV